jgi:hypothetical protein
MIEIKEGTLVKAWNDIDPDNFVIGKYDFKGKHSGCHFVFVDEDWKVSFNNVVEIPPELAKQLKELGQ